MRDFHQNYLYQPTGTEKKGHKNKNHQERDEFCKCYVPLMKCHHYDCPLAKKTCPLHGNSLHQGATEKLEQSLEQNMIISFHPSSKTDRLFHPIKALLARSPDTKVNFQYYSPKDYSPKKESHRHCHIQTSVEDLKKSSGNNFFVEKTKSFVADKTNKMKKLKQCFYSPCSSIIRRTKSQISVKEKNGELDREEARKGPEEFCYGLLTESDEPLAKPSLCWLHHDKLGSSFSKKLSRAELDSDFVTVTHHDKKDIVNHKIFEVKHKKKGGEDVASASLPHPYNFAVHFADMRARSRAAFDRMDSTTDRVFLRKNDNDGDNEDEDEDEDDGGDKKKKNDSADEKSIENSSKSSESVYFTPFIFVPIGMRDSDSNQQSLASCETAEEPQEEAVEKQPLKRTSSTSSPPVERRTTPSSPPEERRTTPSSPPVERRTTPSSPPEEIRTYPSSPAGERTYPSSPAGERTYPSSPAGERTYPSSPAGERTSPSSPVGERTSPSSPAGERTSPSSPAEKARPSQTSEPDTKDNADKKVAWTQASFTSSESSRKPSSDESVPKYLDKNLQTEDKPRLRSSEPEETVLPEQDAVRGEEDHKTQTQKRFANADTQTSFESRKSEGTETEQPRDTNEEQHRRSTSGSGRYQDQPQADTRRPQEGGLMAATQTDEDPPRGSTGSTRDGQRQSQASSLYASRKPHEVDLMEAFLADQNGPRRSTGSARDDQRQSQGSSPHEKFPYASRKQPEVDLMETSLMGLNQPSRSTGSTRDGQPQSQASSPYASRKPHEVDLMEGFLIDQEPPRSAGSMRDGERVSRGTSPYPTRRPYEVDLAGAFPVDQEPPRRSTEAMRDGQRRSEGLPPYASRRPEEKELKQNLPLGHVSSKGSAPEQKQRYPREQPASSSSRFTRRDGSGLPGEVLSGHYEPRKRIIVEQRNERLVQKHTEIPSAHPKSQDGFIIMEESLRSYHELHQRITSQRGEHFVQQRSLSHRGRPVTPDRMVQPEENVHGYDEPRRKMTSKKEEGYAQRQVPRRPSTPNENALNEQNLPPPQDTRRKVMPGKTRGFVQQTSSRYSNNSDEILLLEETLSDDNERPKRSPPEKRENIVTQTSSHRSTRRNEMTFVQGSVRGQAPEKREPGNTQQKTSPGRSARANAAPLPQGNAPSQHEPKLSNRKSRQSISRDNHEREREERREPRDTAKQRYQDPSNSLRKDFKSVLLEMVRNTRSSAFVIHKDQFTQTSVYSATQSHSYKNIVIESDYKSTDSVTSDMSGVARELPESFNENREKNTSRRESEKMSKQQKTGTDGDASAAKQIGTMSGLQVIEIYNRREEHVKTLSEVQPKHSVHTAERRLLKKRAEDVASQTNQTPVRNVEVEVEFEAEVGKGQATVSSHTAEEVRTSSRTGFSAADSTKAENGSTTPGISEASDKTYNKVTTDDEYESMDDHDISPVSDLSEVTKMIYKLFDSIEDGQVRFCDCKPQIQREGKADVDRETMTEPMEQTQTGQQATIVSTGVQTPFKVVVDRTEELSSSFTVDGNLSRVRIRRSILINEKDQSKDIFVCSICAREIQRYSAEVGTSTDETFRLIAQQPAPASKMPDDANRLKTVRKPDPPAAPPDTSKPVKTPNKPVDGSGGSSPTKKTPPPRPSPTQKQRPAHRGPSNSTGSKRGSVTSTSRLPVFLPRPLASKPDNSPKPPPPTFDNVQAKRQKDTSPTGRQSALTPLNIPQGCICTFEEVGRPSTSARTPVATDIYPSLRTQRHPGVSGNPPNRDNKPPTGKGKPPQRVSAFHYPAIVSFSKNLRSNTKLHREASIPCERSISRQKRSRENETADGESHGKKIRFGEFDEIDILDFCKEKYEGTQDRLSSEGDSSLKVAESSRIWDARKKERTASKTSGEFVRMFPMSRQISVSNEKSSLGLKDVKSDECLREGIANQSAVFPRKEVIVKPFKNYYAPGIQHQEAQDGQPPIRKLFKCRFCKSLTYNRCENYVATAESVIANPSPVPLIFIPAKSSRSIEELLQECVDAPAKAIVSDFPHECTAAAAAAEETTSVTGELFFALNSDGRETDFGTSHDKTSEISLSPKSQSYDSGSDKCDMKEADTDSSFKIFWFGDDPGN